MGRPAGTDSRAHLHHCFLRSSPRLWLSQVLTIESLTRFYKSMEGPSQTRALLINVKMQHFATPLPPPSCCRAENWAIGCQTTNTKFEPSRLKLQIANYIDLLLVKSRGSCCIQVKKNIICCGELQVCCWELTHPCMLMNIAHWMGVAEIFIMHECCKELHHACVLLRITPCLCIAENCTMHVCCWTLHSACVLLRFSTCMSVHENYTMPVCQW